MKVNKQYFLVIFLGLLSAFGPFVLDLYLPALPTIASYYGVESSLIQLTLTGSMLGLAIGQILIGPISDKYGRKSPLIISLVIYIGSSVAIVFAWDVYAMIFFRIVQGLAASGALVISRAVATDLYRGNELKIFFGMLMMVNGLAPIISPVLGGILLSVVTWQGLFVVLSVIGLLLLLAAVRFNETHSKDNRIKGNIIATYLTIIKIIKNKKYLKLVAIQAFGMSAMFAYIASSPFIFQIQYGISSILYGIIFASNGFALMLGARISRNFNAKKSINYGVVIMLVASIILLVSLTLKLSIVLVEIGFFVQLFGLGSITPSTSSLAMESERENAGGASAVLGGVSFLFGGIVSPLVGIGNTMYATPIVIVISVLVSYIIFKKTEKII